MDESIEKFTKESIFKDLGKGDPLWDVPHTKAVVHHLKEILKYTPGLEIDETVLVLAAYGHDWGYFDFYKPGESLEKEEYMEAKKAHAHTSYEKMKDLLKKDIYKPLSDKQKDRILHLILVHDELDILKDQDELVLMEADTLGGLDTDFIASGWTKEQTLKHIKKVEKERLPRFITNYGKHMFEVCAQKRIKAALKKL